MKNLLTLESAYTDKNVFVGHRITCRGEVLLVFADEFSGGVPGFRACDKFTPSFGGTISYNTEEIYPEA